MGLFNRLFGPPSPDAFARMVLKAMRGAGAAEPLNYDAEQFQIVLHDGSISFLGNAYAEYCAAPRKIRAEVIKRQVRASYAAKRDMPADFEDAKPDLLPVVRARAYFELAAIHFDVNGTGHFEALYQPLGDHLAIGLVYDMAECTRSISQQDLDDWGVTFYEALEIARDNLANLPMAVIGPQDGPGVYLTGSGDNYDASRRIRLDVIREFNCRGDYIAMVPHRDSLIVGGSEDIDGLGGMLELAEKAINEPRPITGLAFRLDGDDWVPWLPPVGHPHYRRFRMLAVQWQGQDYHEQKELLEQLHEKQGEDIFVASYAAFESNTTGELNTYCVWGEGVRALLPRTDLVAVLREDGPKMFVPWEAVQSVCGDLMQPTGLYPGEVPRHRVSDGRAIAGDEHAGY